MAPRQLRLEPIEANQTADKGAKRVRVDSNDESSSQIVQVMDPFLPTPAELAGEDPDVRAADVDNQERQARLRIYASHICLDRRGQGQGENGA